MREFPVVRKCPIGGGTAETNLDTWAIPTERMTPTPLRSVNKRYPDNRAGHRKFAIIICDCSSGVLYPTGSNVPLRLSWLTIKLRVDLATFKRDLFSVGMHADQGERGQEGEPTVARKIRERTEAHEDYKKGFLFLVQTKSVWLHSDSIG